VRSVVECRSLRIDALQGGHGHHRGTGICVDVAHAFWTAVTGALRGISCFAAELQTYARVLERRTYGNRCSRTGLWRVLGNTRSAASYGESRIIEIDAVHLIRQHFAEIPHHGYPRRAWTAKDGAVDGLCVSLRYFGVGRLAAFRSFHQRVHHFSRRF